MYFLEVSADIHDCFSQPRGDLPAILPPEEGHLLYRDRSQFWPLSTGWFAWLGRLAAVRSRQSWLG